MTVTGPPGATFTCPKCQTVNSIPAIAQVVVEAKAVAATKPVPAKKEANPVVGFIVLLVVGGIIWATCFHSNGSGGGGTPGAGSVATSGTATERALCAALDGDPRDLPPLIAAVNNDAEAGASLVFEGAELEMYLGITNNAAKVQGVINDMKDTCASQAG